MTARAPEQANALPEVIELALRDENPAQQRVEVILTGQCRWQLHVAACSEGGDSRRLNEDAFAVAVRDEQLLAGVFDGTTSLRAIRSLEQHGVSGARFASAFLRHSLGSVDPHRSAGDALRELNLRLRALSSGLEGFDPDDVNTLPASSATLVKFDARAGAMQLAHVYDSWCVAYFHDGRSELLTENRNRPFDEAVFDLMAKLARAQGVTPREVRAQPAIQDALVRSRATKSNRPDGAGTGLLNGDPNMSAYIQERELPLHALRAVLLGTDGLVPQGWNVEDERDRDRMFAEIANGGLPRLLEAKRRSEDADPDWWHIRDKHSDDATGVFIELKSLD